MSDRDDQRSDVPRRPRSHLHRPRRLRDIDPTRHGLVLGATALLAV